MANTIFDIPDASGGYNLTGKKVLVHDTTQPEATSTVRVNATSLVRPYRVFTATMAQNGTNNPSFVNILENTLGYVPVFVRTNPGNYSCSTFIDSQENEDAAKIVFFVTERMLDGGNGEMPVKISIGITNEDNTVSLFTYKFNATTHNFELSDDVLSESTDEFWRSTLEIRIYD